MTPRTFLLSTAVIPALLLGLGPSARAAGYAILEQSAEGQGTSHAGSAARAEDPSTLFYNPAGMARLPGYQFSISGTLIMPQSTLQSGSASTNIPGGTVPVIGTVGTDAGVNAGIPALYGTAQIAPNWHIGLSVTAPYGLVTQYPPSSIARYYALTSQLSTIDIAPAVSWQALPTLALGASLIVETAAARLTNAVDFGTIGAGLGLGRFGLLPGRADGIATLKGSGTALGWQIGGLFEPRAGTRLGLTYRSAITHTLDGTVEFENVPALLAPGFRGGAASAKVVTPSNVSLGIAQDIGRFTVLGGLTWTQWSHFHDLLAVYQGGSSFTEENWHDTVTVSAGVEYHVNDAFTLRTGVAWDQSPVPDSTRTPRIPDGNRTWLSIGATWNATRNVALSLAYSHIFVADTKVALTDLGPGTPNFLRGNLNANYSNQVNIIAAQATFRF